MSQEKQVAAADKVSELPLTRFPNTFCMLVAGCLTVAGCFFLPARGQISAGTSADTSDSGVVGDQDLQKPPFPPGDATAEGISEEALQELVKRALQTNSNSLVVIKNGKLIGQWYFGKKIRAHCIHSITKSITSLAIGRLIDQHKIASLGEPISTFYPQWSVGAKGGITLKHILSQASGLDERADFSQPDLVKVALDSALKDKPGSKFVYNDRASNLLAGVVQIASGKPIDAYVGGEIFAPLAIHNYHWDKDQAGQPLVMGGLYLNAIDLAKIGQLIVNGGMWEGKQIVSATWIETATARPSLNPGYGLMWWLIEEGINGSGVSPIIGCRASGHLGQALIVLPKQKLVVVRQISEKGHKDSADDFGDLPALTRALLGH